MVHEWVEPIGGSENVLEALAALMPGCDLVCAWMNAAERFPGRRIIETSLASSPARDRKSLALPLSAYAWRSLPGDYRWALVSSHAFAHHCRFRDQPDNFVKLVYVHSPARYVWNPELDDRGASAWVRAAARPLRRLDRHRAAEATAIAANSVYVAERVRRHWHREASVIHPPVEVSAITAVSDWVDVLDADDQAVLAGLPETFVLGASRLIPYKRLHLAITAGEQSGLPVVLAGSGPLQATLAEQAEAAGVDVRLLGRVSTPLLRALYQRAHCLVFPAVEDFGIMPVEAMAVGCPVVASAVGGTAETVEPDRSGQVVRDWSDHDEVRDAVARAAALPRDPIRHHATLFSAERFAAEVETWVRSYVPPDREAR